jgi:hypothetical protein
MNLAKIGFLAVLIAATIVPTFSSPAEAKKHWGNNHGWNNNWSGNNGKHLGWWRGRGHHSRFIQNPVVYPNYYNNNYWNNNNWNTDWRYRNHWR